MKESWISVWWVALINGLWIIADLIAKRFHGTFVLNVTASDVVGAAAAFLCLVYAIYVHFAISTHRADQNDGEHRNKD